jgi:predicted PurR-regulated permease PerM
MKKRTIIISVLIFLAVLILIGSIGVWLTVRSASQMFTAVPQFWDTYESKPPSYYKEFSEACDRILDAYSDYTDYPLYIPVENNPVISEIIMSAEPKIITIWSDTHISITLVHLGKGTGFHITWKKDWTTNTWNLFLGSDTREGTIVYTKQASV